MTRGRTAALTLAIGLMLTAPSVYADQNQEPADDSPFEVASVWFDTLYGAVVPGALHSRSLVRQCCRDDAGAKGMQVGRGEATESIALGEGRSTCSERSN